MTQVNFITECFGTTIYMETQCLQTNEMQHCLGKESALRVEGGVEKVVLIKSLIFLSDRKNALRAEVCQVRLKLSADIIFFVAMVLTDFNENFGCQFSLILKYKFKNVQSMLFFDSGSVLPRDTFTHTQPNHPQNRLETS